VCAVAAAVVAVGGLVAVAGSSPGGRVTISAAGIPGGGIGGDGIPGLGAAPAGAAGGAAAGLGLASQPDGDGPGPDPAAAGGSLGAGAGDTGTGGPAVSPTTATGPGQAGATIDIGAHVPLDLPVDPTSRLTTTTTERPPVTTTRGSLPWPPLTSTTRPPTTLPPPVTTTTIVPVPGGGGPAADARIVYMRQVQQDAPYDTDLFSATVDGRDERRLTAGPAHDQYPAWSPDGTTIAFTRSVDGRDELWLMNPDGSRPRPVTAGGAAVKRWPAWSPDGRYLAYQSGVWSAPYWTLRIAVVDLRTGGVTDVTPGPDDRFPSFSPDGTQLAFDGRSGNADSDFDVFLVNRDGSGLRNVTNAPRDYEGEAYEFPKWNAAGTRLLVYYQHPEGGTILTMDLQGGHRMPITTDGAQPAGGSGCGGTLQYPSWSPDEDAVVFNGCDGLRVVNVDGTGLRRLDPAPVADWRWQADWQRRG
jgi:Tol biopolymer transport system component